MANLTLKSLLSAKTGAAPIVTDLLASLGNGIAIEDAAGQVLTGTAEPQAMRLPIAGDGAGLGWVISNNEPAAKAIASLLGYLGAKEGERRALAGEVLHLYREVNLIERLSEQLAALLDLAAVGQSALGQAHQLIAATQGAVFVVEDGAGLQPVASLGERSAGLLAQAGKTLERGVAEIINTEDASLVCIPLRAKQRTVGVIALGNVAGAPYFSKDLKLLNTIAMQTAAAIENSLLCAEMVDAVRNREQLASIHKELDTARTIQHSLVPRVFPPFPQRTDFELHAEMTAARSVGGDFFDFFLIDDNRLGIVIGDVSGKGIPAALFMAVTRTMIKTIALEGLRPEQCLREVNRALVREKASTMYATCFYGILNTRTGVFQFCNGGHNAPLLLRATGVIEPARVFENGGLPIGLFDGPAYAGGTVMLEPGDALFLYTDGVTEANNAALDDFSDARLAEVIQSSTALSCVEMIESVSRQVAAFVAGAPQSDDITMVALRVKHNA
jgi:serine phosphatase RsbU (regulator of sigma subunit)